ncbi:MAG TPA: DUF4157 domain-containing protein, partial [Kofleriaceae bacterium]|nr:DUF4157 domain-containing protein [Kofleriaceae bacterium]
GGVVGPDPETAVATAASSSGAPLPDPLRNQFESSLGTELSSVRVHTGSESQTAASAVGARAYAVGNDIHFGAGQYDPSSSDGQFLIAHEVAHTVQQRGGSMTRQNKLVLSSGSDSAELEADRAASAMVQGAPTTVSTVGGGVVHRKAFGGYAGTAESRANTASANAAPGLSPISISTAHATSRAEFFASKQSEFERGDIPGYHDGANNTKHGLYPLLGEIRQGYLGDVARIQQAEAAYNGFVEPAALAEKMMVKFRAMQKEMGFNVEEESPADSLSDPQKKALAKSVDKEKLATLKSTVNAKQNLATGTRKELLGSAQAGRAAAQGRLAELEEEKRKAADDEKAKIDEKIKAAKEAVEAIIKVCEFAGAVASGGATAAAPGAAALGVTPLSAEGMGKALGKQSTGLIGTGVEAVMQRYYKEDIQNLKNKSRNAAQAVSAAKAVDTAFRGEAEILRCEGQAQQLSGHMEDWANAAKAQHDYYVEVAAAAEKASGGGAGGAITQVMALASTASEARPHLSAGKSMATSAATSITTQHAGMVPHRNKMYGTLADASYGVTKYEGEGPDGAAVRACADKCNDWAKQAAKDELLLNRAENVVG